MQLLNILTYLTLLSFRYFTSAVSLTERESALNFLLLGDWGKGGNSGYVATRISDGTSEADDDEGPDTQKSAYVDVRSRRNMHKTDVLETNRSLQNNNNNNKGTYQAAIAKAMASYSNEFQPSFVVALGDNFYTNGVSSSTDVYWDYLWTNVYLDYYASLRIPWYPVFGNHDYGYGAKGIQAQLDRTLIDDFWSFKSTNYSKSFEIPNGGLLTIVFVDTTTLAPSVNKCCNENGGISTAVQAVRIQNQLEHINSMLEEANRRNPTWLLVAGHYPIYSVGEHGDTSELQSYLQPLLQKYGVHAYFCGHDHLSEHLKYQDTHYFVAGGGAMTDYAGASSSATALWSGEGYSAFASAAATKEDLIINFIDVDGNKKYSYTLANPRSGEPIYPTYRPSEMTTPIKPAAYATQKVVVISSGFAAFAFLLIAGGFYYESKGKKKKRKAKKGTKGFMSYALTGGSVTKSLKKASKSKNSLRALATNRTPRNLEEAMMDLVSNKKDFVTAETNEERTRDDFTVPHNQQPKSIILGTNTGSETAFPSPSAKRFNTDHPGNSKVGTNDGEVNTHNNNTTDDTHYTNRRNPTSNAAPAWDEETANARPQHVPHTIITHLTSSTPIGIQRSKDGRIFEAIPDARNEHHKRARTSIF